MEPALDKQLPCSRAQPRSDHEDGDAGVEGPEKFEPAANDGVNITRFQASPGFDHNMGARTRGGAIIAENAMFARSEQSGYFVQCRHAARS